VLQKKHSRQRHPRHASLLIKSPTTTMLLFSCNSNRPSTTSVSPSFSVDTLPLSILFSNLFRLVAEHLFSQLPLAFIESKMQVVHFRRVASLCVINIINLITTDVFTIKWRWSVPKIMEIGSGILKMWAADVSRQRKWPHFLNHPVCNCLQTA